MAPTTDVKDNVLYRPGLELPKLRGLGSSLFYKMQEHGKNIAQIDGLTGEKETFDDLLQKCVRTAIKLRSLGIKYGDIITICSTIHMDICVPYIGALFLGAKVTSIDTTTPLPDTLHLLKQVKPKMVFVTPNAIAKISEVLGEINNGTEIVVFGETDKYLSFSTFLVESDEEHDFRPIEIENIHEVGAIFFSSGTTGLPKPTCLSHYSMLGSNNLLHWMVEPNDVFLLFSSYHWISPTIVLLHSIFNGYARLIYPKYDPQTVWELITKFKVTKVFVPPIYAIMMSKDGVPETADTSSLQYLLTGGGPMSADQIAMIRSKIPNVAVYNFYGQTELSGLVSFFTKEDKELAAQKSNSIGKTCAGAYLKIVDVDTEEPLGPFQEGEIRVKSEFAMNGYLNIDSSSNWDAQGFLKTGDVGYYDNDKCLYIVDRLKELMKYQMWQIAPAKLEGVLLSHPQIKSAVVFGTPHPKDGDLPTGVVVLKESAEGSVTPQEIEKFVEEKVDDRERLRGGVKFVKTIPTTATGKLSRLHIRKLAAEGLL